MSYVSDNLLNGEVIEFQSEVHWCVYITPALLLVLAVMVSFNRNNFVVTGALFFLSMVFAIRAYILRESTELAVTNKRVITKFGLVSRATNEINLSKMESLVVDQTVWGRILGFGTIIISGTGGDKVVVPLIEDPYNFRKKTLEVADQFSK